MKEMFYFKFRYDKYKEQLGNVLQYLIWHQYNCKSIHAIRNRYMDTL